MSQWRNPISTADCRRLHGRRGLKFDTFEYLFNCHLSPPSRAAWIEMYLRMLFFMLSGVAAFTGGVD